MSAEIGLEITAQDIREALDLPERGVSQVLLREVAFLRRLARGGDGTANNDSYWREALAAAENELRELLVIGAPVAPGRLDAKLENGKLVITDTRAAPSEPPENQKRRTAMSLKARQTRTTEHTPQTGDSTPRQHEARMEQIEKRVGRLFEIRKMKQFSNKFLSNGQPSPLDCLDEMIEGRHMADGLLTYCELAQQALDSEGTALVEPVEGWVVQAIKLQVEKMLVAGLALSDIHHARNQADTTKPDPNTPSR